MTITMLLISLNTVNGCRGNQWEKKGNKKAIDISIRKTQRYNGKQWPKLEIWLLVAVSSVVSSLASHKT
jgi:hypothetical protein